MILVRYATKVECSTYQATLIIVIKIIESVAQREVNHYVGVKSNFIFFIIIFDVSAITRWWWIAAVACSSIAVGSRNHRWRWRWRWVVIITTIAITTTIVIRIIIIIISAC